MTDNTIDEVMKRCIEDPTLLGPADIDTIVDYYRSSKQLYDSGVKIPKRATQKLDLDAPAISLSSLNITKTAPTVKLRRPRFT